MRTALCPVAAVDLCLALIWFSASAAAAGPLEPGSTVCLRPLTIPIEDKDAEARRAEIEARLRRALIGATYLVPQPKAVGDLTERVEKAVGGTIDPATGRRDSQRQREFKAQYAAALRSELSCDALLSARVAYVRAPFFGSDARWDGATEPVVSSGRVVLKALGGVTESGWVAALSLWLHATDLEGNDLAFRSAGIETLVSLAVTRDQDILPEDLWLTDATKVEKAIASALGPNGEALRHDGVPSAVSTR